MMLGVKKLSSSYDIAIVLPPRGMLIRDLTLSFIAAFATTAKKLDKSCHITHDYESVYITLERESDWPLIIDSLLMATQKLLELKRSTLRCPQLHFNDYTNVFRGLLGMKISKKSSYLDAFASLVAEPDYCSILRDPNTGVKHLASITFDKSSLFFGLKVPGIKGYALIQPLKVEAYENGFTFHAPYTMDLEIRTTIPWIIVFGIGFAFSYSGMTPEGLSFITPDEDSLMNLNDMRLSTAIDISSSLLRAPVDPVIPYSMYVAFLVPELISASKSPEVLGSEVKDFEEYLLSDEEVEALQRGDIAIPRIKLHKMSTTIRAYTMLLKESVDISLLTKYAYALDELTGGPYCRKAIVNNVIRGALGGREPKNVNATMLLYEAIHGAKDPYYSVYYIARNFSLEPSNVDGMIRAFDRLIKQGAFDAR